jgi:hypothetical protein
MIAQRLDEFTGAPGFDQVTAAVGAPEGIAGKSRALFEELYPPRQAIGRHGPEALGFDDLHRALVGRETPHAVITGVAHGVVFLCARGCALSYTFARC